MIPIKKILVPVDFTESSNRAVQYSASIAKQFDAKVVLAHIVADPAITTGAFPTESHALAYALFEAAKENIRKVVTSNDKLSQDTETIVRIGDVDADLLNVVQEKAIDLVVMGTHGRRTPARWFLGSVTERMLRRLPVPVLTISHLDHESSRIKRILYATDLRDEPRSGFRVAVDLARATGAKLTVLYAVEHLEYVWAGAMNGYMRAQGLEMVRISRKHLEEFINQEKPAGVDVDSTVVEGHPYEQILRTAKERDCDLIVLNLQGKTIVDRAFLGATAERVVRLSGIPVLSIPATLRQ